MDLRRSTEEYGVHNGEHLLKTKKEMDGTYGSHRFFYSFFFFLSLLLPLHPGNKQTNKIFTTTAHACYLLPSGIPISYQQPPQRTAATQIVIPRGTILILFPHLSFLPFRFVLFYYYYFTFSYHSVPDP